LNLFAEAKASLSVDALAAKGVPQINASVIKLESNAIAGVTLA